MMYCDREILDCRVASQTPPSLSGLKKVYVKRSYYMSVKYAFKFCMIVCLKYNKVK